MNAKLISFVCGVALLLGSTVALAAYTRAWSSPVHIRSIYANEWGSPYVYFTTSVNSACGGMYLYDLAIPTPDDPSVLERRKSKMATALAAKLADKRVVLDYFYDPSISGWDACYIHGIEISD